MWSKQSKDGLLRHNPRLIMVDALGLVSEAIGMATNTDHVGDRAARPPSSNSGPNTRRRHRRRASTWLRGPESWAWWRSEGGTPIGYYKDEAKSAATFQCDRRAALLDPGRLRRGGSSTAPSNCSGRGSQCINTGGEKVYPEEVEECLKLHPAVHDAGGRRAARRAVRRSDHGAGRARARGRRRRRRTDRARQGAPGRATRRPSRSSPSTRSDGPPTANSTTRHSRRSPSRADRTHGLGTPDYRPVAWSP